MWGDFKTMPKGVLQSEMGVVVVVVVVVIVFETVFRSVVDGV